MSSIIRVRNGVIVCSFVTNDGTTPSRRRRYPHQVSSGDPATPYGAAVPFNPIAKPPVAVREKQVDLWGRSDAQTLATDHWRGVARLCRPHYGAEGCLAISVGSKYYRVLGQ